MSLLFIIVLLMVTGTSIGFFGRSIMESMVEKNLF
jgi:hypothetical protein